MPMAKQYIVKTEVLPEVILQVIHAKELLQTGQAATIGQAVEQAGISRSAFYKYRDAVIPFRDMRDGQVLTLNIILLDSPGTLSAVLEVFARIRANILTINQSVPSDGVAGVTISIMMENMSLTVDELRGLLEEIPEVIRTELVAF